MQHRSLTDLRDALGASTASLAAAGSTQSDAADISATMTLVTGADGTKGVVLPAPQKGDIRYIYNTGTSAVKVYPASGDDINDASADAEVSLSGKALGIFIATDGATWAFTGSEGSVAEDFGAAGLKADIVAESTGGTGVTIDGVILKDTTVDVNGTADAIILDADADTTISSPTDDQIDVEIAGADDFRFTANTFTALSGSTIATDTIAETTNNTGVTIDGVLLKDADITAEVMSAIGYAYGATGIATLAALGVNQGDAAPIANAITYVTGSDGAKGVVLPTAIAGLQYVVYNTVASNLLKVYPGSSDDINDGTTNVHISLAGKSAGTFTAIDNTTWIFEGRDVSVGSEFGAAGIKADVVAESTSGSGVTVDGVLLKDATVDVNGTADAIILDADADTTISSPTDDQIDVEIAGADDFQFTANTFTALSGSTIASDTLAETTAGSGITADSVHLKDGQVRQVQAAPTAKTTSAGLEAAEILGGLITVTHAAGANQDYQLPLGTELEALITGTNESFDWSIINKSGTPATNTATITVDTGHTIEGSAVVGDSANASGRFRTRRSASNTFISYRLSAILLALTALSQLSTYV